MRNIQPAAEIQLGEGADDVRARSGLLLGRDGVLKIDANGIGGAARGLLDHRPARCRYKQYALFKSGRIFPAACRGISSTSSVRPGLCETQAPPARPVCVRPAPALRPLRRDPGEIVGLQERLDRPGEAANLNPAAARSELWVTGDGRDIVERRVGDAGAFELFDNLPHGPRRKQLLDRAFKRDAMLDAQFIRRER